jgi:ATP-binding cassette subfamily C (CFTR/MRP) protein 1
VLSAKLDAAWARRVREADAYNARLAAGDVRLPLKLRLRWALLGAQRRADAERRWRDAGGRRAPSLAWALNEVFGFDFWSAGLFKVRRAGVCVCARAG